MICDCIEASFVLYSTLVFIIGNYVFVVTTLKSCEEENLLSYYGRRSSTYTCFNRIQYG